MTKEFQEKYDALFGSIKTSKRESALDIFKSVTDEMLDFAYQRDPSVVQAWMDELGAVEWHNYLTKKEAEKIVSEMDDALWTRDTWISQMDSYGLDKEDKPSYNPDALFVEMNKVYAEHSASIAQIMNTPIEDIPSETMMIAVYLLANDRLKGKTDIRKEYGL